MNQFIWKCWQCEKDVPFQFPKDTFICQLTVACSDCFHKAIRDTCDEVDAKSRKVRKNRVEKIKKKKETVISL